MWTIIRDEIRATLRNRTMTLRVDGDIISDPRTVGDRLHNRFAMKSMSAVN